MTQDHFETQALVTGGSQGLGLAIAHELIAQGCSRLVIADLNAEKGEAAAKALAVSGAEVDFVHVDMGDTEAAGALVNTAIQKMGRVTSLVNCAALTDRGSVLDTTPELWDRMFEVNTKGPFFALQRFARHCIDQGHAGTCVNILSIVVHGGLPFLAPYGASKAALLYITKNAANTLADNRIRVNGINVGWMDTPGEDETQRKYHGRSEGWLGDAEANLPFGMLVKPQHVARQAAFFLGPQSGVVTGAILDFDQRVVGAYPDTNDS